MPAEPPPEYLREMPTTIPSGRVLVHNSVRPTRRLGSRGFRAWFDTADASNLVQCGCDWAPELGAHFQIRRELSEPEVRDAISRVGRRETSPDDAPPCDQPG